MTRYLNTILGLIFIVPTIFLALILIAMLLIWGRQERLAEKVAQLEDVVFNGSYTITRKGE